MYLDFCDMCDNNDVQRRKEMKIMLKEPARAYCTRNIMEARTFEEAVNLPRKRYNRRDKKYCLLNEWKEMSLTRAIKDDPEGSEVGLFQTFLARTMAIRGQLTSSYQGDRYVRDRLQEPIYLTSIQDLLRDRPSNESQELINRVANKLSNRPKTIGAVLENWGFPTGNGSRRNCKFHPKIKI